MKKFAVIFLVVIILLFTLSACNGVSNSDTVNLTKDMSAEDIFEIIKNAKSFSIEVGDNDYRFIKNVGYSISEEIEVNQNTVKVYELFYVDGNILYSVQKNQNVGFNATKRAVKEADYQKITDTYNEYIDYARGSYASTKEGVEVSLEVDKNEALIKTIYKQNEGSLTISTCRLYAINDTTLYIPNAYSNYKEIAKDEEMS